MGIKPDTRQTKGESNDAATFQIFLSNLCCDDAVFVGLRKPAFLLPFVIAIQILALALGIWARRTFQAGQFSTSAETKEGQLLLTGPYKFIRHPIYTTVLVLVWSSVLGHPSLTTLMVSVIMTVITVIRIVTEEQFLRERYQGFTDYSRTTKRIVPFIF